MAERPQSEVKGIWFVAALDYARDAHGDARMRQLIETSRHKYADVYRNPVGSAWYPEEALQQLLTLLYDVLAQQHDSTFERIVEGCTEQGVNRLFQMLLRMSSPAFVLRHVPTMWRQIRRGPGQVVVENHDGHSVIRYSEFPWFWDKSYRLLTTASLRAIVRCCANEAPRVEVLDHTSDTLSVRLAYRASANLAVRATQSVPVAGRAPAPANAPSSHPITRPSVAPATGSRRKSYDSAAPSPLPGTPVRPPLPNKS